MNRYLAEITRTDYGFIEVEAESVEEAIDIAVEKEQEGKTEWTSTGAEVTRITKMGVKNERE